MARVRGGACAPGPTAWFRVQASSDAFSWHDHPVDGVLATIDTGRDGEIRRETGVQGRRPRVGDLQRVGLAGGGQGGRTGQGGRQDGSSRTDHGHRVRGQQGRRRAMAVAHVVAQDVLVPECCGGGPQGERDRTQAGVGRDARRRRLRADHDGGATHRIGGEGPARSRLLGTQGGVGWAAVRDEDVSHHRARCRTGAVVGDVDVN